MYCYTLKNKGARKNQKGDFTAMLEEIFFGSPKNLSLSQGSLKNLFFQCHDKPFFGTAKNPSQRFFKEQFFMSLCSL